MITLLLIGLTSLIIYLKPFSKLSQNSIVGEGIGNGYNILLFRNARNISYINNFNVFSTESDLRESSSDISSKGLSQFVAKTKGLEYFIALEPDSVFGS